MPSLKSSLFSSTDYDEASKTLTLHFRNGETYSYPDVSPDTFHNLIHAQSAGQFFQKNIRPHFQGIKVKKQ